jgi:hypothetical protein
MGEELGRCRFYGVEVVTLCRLEVTQRDKLIDAPWPELHTHVSYAVTASLAVSPHARRRGGGTWFCRHAFDGYAMGVKNRLRCLRPRRMADAIEEVARSLGRETVPRGRSQRGRTVGYP